MLQLSGNIPILAKWKGKVKEETGILYKRQKFRYNEEGKLLRQKKRKTGESSRLAALCGMMTALAFLFGYIEMLIPIQLGIPGMKLGLANLVTMVSLYLLGARITVFIALARVILTGFTFGNLSMMMYSMAGTVLSLMLMILCKKGDWFGTIGVSILGGIGHNTGQLLMAAAVVQTGAVFSYFPYLLIAGMAAGAVIGMLGGMIVKRLSHLIRE